MAILMAGITHTLTRAFARARTHAHSETDTKGEVSQCDTGEPRQYKSDSPNIIEARPQKCQQST